MYQLEVTSTLPTTFSELGEAGYIGHGQDIVIGFTDDGAPISLPRPTSLGIAGVQGSGKTNTLLALVLATIAKYDGKVKLLVVDPHMDVDGDQSLWSALEPLSPFFLSYRVPGDVYRVLPNPVRGGKELLDWLAVILTEMDERIAGKTGETWIIIMDEFAAIMRTEASRQVAAMLEAINQEARKVNMFAYVASQEWKSSRTGGTEMRHAIASFAVHNTPAAIASLIIPEDEAKYAPKLKRGEALFSTPGSTIRGNVVLATREDAMRIVQRYHGHRRCKLCPPEDRIEVHAPQWEAAKERARQSAPPKKSLAYCAICGRYLHTDKYVEKVHYPLAGRDYDESGPSPWRVEHPGTKQLVRVHAACLTADNAREYRPVPATRPSSQSQQPYVRHKAKPKPSFVARFLGR